MREIKCCAWCKQYTIKPDSNEVADAIAEIRKINKKKGTLSKVERRRLKILFDKAESHTKDALSMRCNYCGESLIEMEMMSEEEFIDYGKKIYEEFRIFMGSEGLHLPKEIIIRLNKTLGGALCDYDEKLKMFYVEINPLERLKKTNISPLFYHEFTHIYQLVNGRNSTDGESKFYSEYQASAIQMKKMLKFKSINEDRNVSLSSRVVYDNETITIHEYFKRRLNESIDLINRGYKDLNLSSIFHIARHIIYYLGEASVLKGHIGNDSYKAISNIDEMEKDLLSKIKYNDGESIQSFKLLENYVVDSTKDVDKCIFDNMVKDISIWIGKHIPDFKV